MMPDYKPQSKQQANIDSMSEREAKDKLRRLMGGGLGSARVQNELDELAERDADELRDGYQLRFVGKDYARLQAGLATETVIVPNTDHNQKPQNKDSQNLFITGDNLDALKHLENSYTAKVDVIYIDPPYNTGSDGFVYADNFSFSDEDLRLKLGLSTDQVARLRSLEGKSSHSAWLTFMYPRLLIAKRLLKDTGVIFISIDDNEQANLKVLCDEIFVESNRIGEYVWHKKVTGGYDNKNINPQHEYILVYARKYSTNALQPKRRESLYTLVDEEGKKYKWDSLWNIGGLQYSKTLDYPIEAPDGTEIWPVGQRGVSFWLWSKKKVEENRDKLKFQKNEKTGEWRVYKRVYASEGIVSPSIMDKEIVKGNTYSSSEIKNLFDGIKPFDYTKPTTLLKYLIQRSINQQDALILDFFAGSGSLGHAVIQLNAEDGGTRRHIQVQLPERVKPGSEAERAGYTTIDEIARRRLELAAAKIRKDKAEKGEKLPEGWDGGFRHFTLAHASDATLDKLDEFDPDAAFSDDMISPFAADSLVALEADEDKNLPAVPVSGNANGTQTLLTTWLCDDGFGINAEINKMDFAGASASLVGSTLYIIEPGWSTASTKALLNAIGTNKQSISTVVLYPYSFDAIPLRELKDSLRVNLDTDHTVGVVERY